MLRISFAAWRFFFMTQSIKISRHFRQWVTTNVFRSHHKTGCLEGNHHLVVGETWCNLTEHELFFSLGWAEQWPKIRAKHRWSDVFISSLNKQRYFKVKVAHGQTRKNKLHELRGGKLLKKFPAKFVLFSAKLGSLNVQIRNTFKNVIFQAYKWCKICK